MRQALFTVDDVMTFGKYRGKTVGEVMDLNPGYIMWLHDGGVAVVDEKIYNAACAEDANQSPPEEYFWQPG